MTEIPNNRMQVYPAGSLVIAERFRIMREEDDLAKLDMKELLSAAALRLSVVEVRTLSPVQSLDPIIVDLVRAAALLTVAADRLILAKEADDEAHA